ncbi:hypothetical protein EPUS_07497 [Endocarpon pusillum Z07020]|uniref:Protein kinase domain-containing protein n=1 Tax=Endocarpon pusillum (strain Z07020 / HMAS-L-300199) TaxID=1263415 RepID=U1GMR9_ENDPU|nr:uncharacterized protein EPUS_07497 [Endocarpon pusillum Z07020]ERF73563.1 hypothetical protein EPUS_07497 [Endocarpon pusillum Z07020]
MATVRSTGGPRTEFLSSLDEMKVKAVCGRQYVQVEKLQEWMTRGKPRNIDRLLDSCRKDQHGFPIDTNKYMRGDKKCLLVFSIFLELEEGELIYDLRDRGFVDGRLPLDLAYLERVLKNKPNLAQRFNKAQWKYTPLKFEFQDQEKESPADRIVPICLKEEINEGGTAVVYQILVQEEFVSKGLRDAVPNSRYNDQKYGPCYFFALKTYNDGNESLYDNETNAFRGLSKNKGMIQWLFNYSHVEDEKAGRTTYNLVLEYGEYDLERYFLAYLPPQLEDEQLSFWHDLFLVAEAIRDIHEFTDSSGGVVKEYHGWHADIKPANILNVHGEFKLADPGFARFERRGDRNKGGKDDMILLGVTETFGAPECYVAQRSNSRQGKFVRGSRSIDIWSLGCVFSVTATWVVYGNQGLEQFAELRSAAINRISPNRTTSQEAGIVIGSDCFHDGQAVLEDVLHWHKFLRRGIRGSDTITGQVLQLVEEKMLLKDASSRISAQDLCEELQGILQSVQSLHSQIPPHHETIRKALNRTEEKWAAKTKADAEDAARKPLGSLKSEAATPSSRGLHPTRGGQISQLLTPMQTSHRSKASGKASSIITTPSRVLIATSTDNTGSRLVVQSSAREVDMKRIPEKRYSEGSALVTTPEMSPPKSPPVASTIARTSTNSTSMTSPTSLKRSKTSSILSKFSNFGKKKRDEVLLRHYNERDIVYLIDNGESMERFWPSVRELLLILVTKSQHIDENGMELKFTCSESKFKPSNKVAAFAAEMDKRTHQPMTGEHARQTNMSITLGSMLRNYLTQFSRKKTHTRKMTIIVLTDGIWAGMTENFAVDKEIIEFNQKLSQLGCNDLEHDERRVSIQFVRFGDDPTAIRRLKRLDDQLRFKGVPDIVDTRPYNDDPYHILLGSLSDHADKKGEENAVLSDFQDSSPGLGYMQSGSSPPRILSDEIGSGQNLLMQEPSELELPHTIDQAQAGHQQTLHRMQTPPRRHRTNSHDKPPQQPSFSFSRH